MTSASLLSETSPSAPHCDARPQPISLMLVGDVRLYREGLAASLRAREDLAVLGTAKCDVSALSALRATPPDVLVLDVHGEGSLELAQAVRRELPATKVIAFAVQEREAEIIAFARAGVAGYVSADGSVDDLVTVIRNLAIEEVVCAPQVASGLIRSLAALPGRDGSAAHDEGLTARERQVLRLICDGLSNKEIAQACHIAEATVKNHVHHLLEKLKVENRSQAAARMASAAWAARA